MGGTLSAAVLVVEDDPSLRMLYRVNLELEGYRVFEAPHIARARELLVSETIDVVLLDLRMGDRDGLELLPLIRDEWPGTRVCVLSGAPELGPPQLEGVDAFIRKPFELDHLVETVRRLAAGEAARPCASG